MKKYYDTTGVSAENQQKFEAAAQKQDDRILTIFKSNPTYLFTPFDIHFMMPSVPLTSVRRSISNLTEQKLLVKTGTKKMGSYGRENLTWKLNVI